MIQNLKSNWTPDSGQELVELLEGRAIEKGVKLKFKKRFTDVLVAAASQFALRGYTGASLNNIAEELGVRSGAIYYYIQNKEKALELICEIAIDGYVEFAAEITASPDSAVLKLKRLIHEHLSTLRQRPNFFKVFQINRNDLPDRARWKIGKRIRAYERSVQDIIAAGIESGELRPDLDPRTAMLLMLSMCNSVVLWNERRGSEDIEIISKAISEIFIQGTVKNSSRVEDMK